MIPYLPPPPPVSIFGQQLPVFGLLLFLSLMVTHEVIVRRGRALAAQSDGAVPPEAASRFAKVLLLAAVAGAHLGGVFVDHGLSALRRPSVFLSAASTFSSAAGLLVAAAVGAAYLRIKHHDLRAWADVVAFAFPIGLLISRVGCALAHDHPGRLSTSWLAVRFPAGARFDCGLLEALAAPLFIALAIAVARKRPPPGRLAGAVGAAYAALRFPLDFARATDIPSPDPRFLGLTLAQWICLPLAAAGVYLAVTAGRGAPLTDAARPRSAPGS